MDSFPDIMAFTVRADNSTINPSGEINTSDFLKFLFSVLFLFVCCLSLMLYIARAVGPVLSFLLRYFGLPKNTIFTIGSLQISPLQARVFFQNMYFQNENMSLRIIDGYFTFNFWGHWLQSPHWTPVREFMVRDNLVGTRCRVRVNFKNVRGTIVKVDEGARRVHVQLDPSTGSDAVLTEDEDDDDEGGRNAFGGGRHGDGGSDAPEQRDASDDDSSGAFNDTVATADTLRPFDMGISSSTRRRAAAAAPEAETYPRTSSAPARPRNDAPRATEAAAATYAQRPGTGEEIVKVFDAGDVRIRNRTGLCQLHLNGTRVCLYNATGKYRDLANGQPDKEEPVDEDNDGVAVTGLRQTSSSGSGSGKPHGVMQRLINALKGGVKDTRDLDALDAADHEAAGVEAARKLQQHQRANKSFTQRFFAFIGAIELEMFATTVDIGAAETQHPYFLHITALRSEGKVFVTRDGVYPVDLYRLALDFTMQEVDMRMARMDSKLTENQLLRNPSLRDRAELLFRGTATMLQGDDESFAAGAASSQFIKDYGVLIDGQDKGALHLLFYRDVANVYAGEPRRRETLPKTGCEIILDAPRFCYGPWLEYCRFQIWQYFLPPNFRPLEAPEFVVGKPRPHAGMEFFVEFMRDTRLEVPFKRRAVAPSPPFGIKDSGRKGMLSAVVGAGSQYIQKAFFRMPGEDKQAFEALFTGRNISVTTNAVLERESVFCRMNSLQFFLDRQDDMMWNGRKLWNILPKISGAELYFFMDHVDFFLDLLNDWQFAQSMYHDVPLTTETFNTYERAVQMFVPNVKRFEAFLDGFATVYVNVNPQNVVYADDPCSLAQNTFAILKAQQGSFSMVLPSDQYQLSYVNEVVRPLSVSAKELKAYISLPQSHELFQQVSGSIPFAYCEEAEIDGSFIINVANQSVPQDKFPIVPETGRTKHTNFLNLNLNFTNMHGTLMGPHILGLVNCFQNIFLDNTLTISPDELFWLLRNLQSHATTGKNVRKELKQYIESTAPVGNDMEICVNVRITDLEATAAVGQAKGDPGVRLATGELTFTYIKQFAVTDTAVTLTPVVARLCDSRGRIPRAATDNFLTTGAIRVGLVKHFGRMPLKPKVHEALDAVVDGVSFHLNMEHLVVLMDILKTLESHLRAQDVDLVKAIADAQQMAEYAAVQLRPEAERHQREKETHPTAIYDFYTNYNHINHNAQREQQRRAQLREEQREAARQARLAREQRDAHGAAFSVPFAGVTTSSGLVQEGSWSGAAPTASTGGVGRAMRTPFDHPLIIHSPEAFPSASDYTGDGEVEMRQMSYNDDGVGDGDGVRLSSTQDRRIDSAGGAGALRTQELSSPFSDVMLGGDDGRGRHQGVYPQSSGDGADYGMDRPVVVPIVSTEVEPHRTTTKWGGRPARFLTGVFTRSNRSGGDPESSASLSDQHRHGAGAAAGRANTSLGAGDDDDAEAEAVLEFAGWSVPLDMARGFAYFMEDCNRAEDDSKDYGIFFTHIVVGRVSGTLVVPEKGYIAVELPNGLTFADSSVNDGNSSKRLSVALRALTVKGFVDRETEFRKYCIPVLEAAELGDVVEAMHLQVSLCARQFVAYPFDGSLAAHRQKQRLFVEANDYEGFIRYAFADDGDNGDEDVTAPDTARPPAPPPRQGEGSADRRGVQEAAGGREGSVPNPTSALLHDPPTLPRPQRDVGSGNGRPPLPDGGAMNGRTQRVAATLTGELSASPGVDALSSDGGQGSPAGSPDAPFPTSTGTLTMAKDGTTRADPMLFDLLSLPGSAAEKGSGRGSSTGSVDTTAHTGDRLDGSASQLFPSLRSFGTDTKTDLKGSGKNFATCVSATEFTEGAMEGSSTSESVMDGLFSSGQLPNSAFAADGDGTDSSHRAGPRPAARGGQEGHSKGSSGNGGGGGGRGRGSRTDYWLNDPIPMYLFYRTFFKEEVDHAGSPTLLDYRVCGRPTRNRPVRSRVHCHSALPCASFYRSEAATLFPDYVTAAVISASGAEGRGEPPTPSTTPARPVFGDPVRWPHHIPFDWALRTTDNRGRSQAGTTTKHLHVEAVEPVTVLLTRQAAELGAAAAGAFLKHKAVQDEAVAARERRARGAVSLGDPMTGGLTDGSDGLGAASLRGAKGPMRGTFVKKNTAKKSRVRAQQKRWLSEDSVVSVLVPCVEVKVLTGHPVPVESLPDPRQPLEGMYCSTLVVRNLRFYMWQSRPPTGVEVGADGTRRLSASLKVDTIALVSQIEYEPIVRQGNLVVGVPGVYYDTEKDTIGVVYCTRVQGSGKQDVTRASGGGACNVAVETVAVHITRDFFDYCLALHHTATELQEVVGKALRSAQQANGSDDDGDTNKMLSPRDREGALRGDDPSTQPAPLAEAWMPLGALDMSGMMGGSRRSATAPSKRPSSVKKGAQQRRSGRPGPPAATAEIRGTNPLRILGIESGGTVQGKGHVEHLHFRIVDTRKAGRFIRVDADTATTLDIRQPRANFVLMAPHRLRNRMMQLQCVGDIQLIRASLYPSLLHTVHTRQRNAQNQQPAKWPLSPMDSATGAGEKVGARVSFAKDHVLHRATADTNDRNEESMTSLQPPLYRVTTDVMVGSASSQSNPLSRQGTARGGGSDAAAAAPPTRATSQDRNAPSAAADVFSLVYNVSFTLRTLDVSLLHSSVNYVQLKGRSLMGCAESRPERVSSRECIQMEVLTEAISEPLRKRLRRKAQDARDKAKRSRYAAPPTTTEQLQLTSSASFFTQSLLVHYMADPVLSRNVSGVPEENAGAEAQPRQREGPQSQQRRQHLLDSQVVVAVVSDVAVNAQTTAQHDIAGEQTNIALHVNKILCDSPYRPNAEEVIHPQVHQLISAWRLAAAGMHNPGSGASVLERGGGLSCDDSSNNQGTTGSRFGASSPVSSPTGREPRRVRQKSHTALGRNSAFFLIAQAKCFEAVVGLPQGVTQRFILPEMSAFVQGSSNGRASARIHLHPFRITSRLDDGEDDKLNNYSVTLPHVYILYAHDTIKMTASLLMETVAITVSPLFIKHTLLTYEKLTADIIAVFSNSVPVGDGAAGKPGSPSSPFSPLDAGIFNDSASGSSIWRDLDTDARVRRESRLQRGLKKRQSFLFLLQGVRVAYLTSITNLRFTIRHVNATAESSERVVDKTLHWVVHVANAQVALVDRTDHDQMVAAVDSATRRRRQDPQGEDSSAPASVINAFTENSGSGYMRRRLDAVAGGSIRSRAAVRGHGKSTTSAAMGEREQSRLPPFAPRGDGLPTAMAGANRSGTTAPAASVNGGGMPAPAGSAAAGGSRQDEAHRLRAAHPQGGYIWGSAELSFTLSSGKTDRNRVRAVFQESASFTSYSEDLQEALLDSLGHSYSQWEWAIYSPLVILRFGLVDLLRMSFDETRDDIGRMKSAAEEETEQVRRRLWKNKTFRQLQVEKRRYESVLRHTQEERIHRLRVMTAQLASDVTRRRGGLNITDDHVKMLEDFFNVKKEHRFVATVSNFLAVLPFGDSAFRSLLEELPGTYMCGKEHRHIHAAPCMNRRKFIPTLALKMRLEEISFICSLVSTKRYVPVLMQPLRQLQQERQRKQQQQQQQRGRGGKAQEQWGDAGNRTAQTAEADYISSFRFCGRFQVNHTYLYFTDGSPIADNADLADLITDTNVLGGVGILTAYTDRELRGSRNSAYIACIEAPINIQRKENETQVGAVMDLSGPRIQMSSRLVNILSEIAAESHSEQLTSNLHKHAPRPTRAHTTTTTTTTKARGAAHRPARPSKHADPNATGGEEDGEAEAPGDERGRLHVDVSARLATGTLSMYAHTIPDSGKEPPDHLDTLFSGGNSKFDRRTGTHEKQRHGAGGAGSGVFPSMPGSSKRHGRTLSGRLVGSSDGLLNSQSGVFALPEEQMHNLLTIPVPGVVAQIVADRGGSVFEEDYLAGRVEVRAGTIELSPTITSLAREIEECARVYDQNQQERRRDILNKIQELEKGVARLNVPMHNTLADVLLPLPSSLCNMLSDIRMRNAINLRRGSRTGAERGGGRRSGGQGKKPTPKEAEGAADEDAAGRVSITQTKRSSKAFTGIHIALTSFRLVLNTEPLSSTTLTVFLDDRSSIDLLVKVFQRPTASNRFLNKFPDFSVLLAVHRLRAECQTKLEVKSLEVSLPEAEVEISRRHGLMGEVLSVNANFPLSPRGTDPNVVLRMQHMAQVLAVGQLWMWSLDDTLRSVQRLNARGAAASAAAQKGSTASKGDRGHQRGREKPRSERLMVTICASHGLVRVDLGSGNAHQLFFKRANFALESARHENESEVVLVLGSLTNFSVRSEGVLSGIVGVGAVRLQLFVVRNPDGGVDFMRSPEGRTFRETLAVENVNVMFKERQLRDIFECTVADFHGNSMDGIGEEGYTTTDLDVMLARGTLGVTPSTVPAFLNFVRTISAIVSDQQRIALERLKHAPHFRRSKAAAAAAAAAAGDADSPAPQPLEPLLPPAFQSESGEGRGKQRGPLVAAPVAASSPQWGDSMRSGADSDNKSDGSSGGDSDGDEDSVDTVACIPFFGNELVRVPCGQLRITVEDTKLMLGSTSSSTEAAAAGSVVASFTKGRLSFAECPCDDYMAAKKVLVIETQNVELYRPGTPRVVIMGFHGTNFFEFYTRQVLGERDVGFTLTLRQTHPWTGNPRFRDFEEIIDLIRSFTDKKNASVFHQFGQLGPDDAAFTAMMRDGSVTGGGGQREVTTESFFNEVYSPVLRQPSTALATPPSKANHSSSPVTRRNSVTASGGAAPLLQPAASLESDVRVLRPLKGTKFSPQLRFGGDVSVNTEVILNWLGITEKMLPNVVNAQLCDALERVLYMLADVASERVVTEKRKKQKKKKLTDRSGSAGAAV